MSALRAARVGDHAEHGAYPRAAMERAMKVQDVMLQAMAKKITWWQARMMRLMLDVESSFHGKKTFV